MKGKNFHILELLAEWKLLGETALIACLREWKVNLFPVWNQHSHCVFLSALPPQYHNSYVRPWPAKSKICSSALWSDSDVGPQSQWYVPASSGSAPKLRRWSTECKMLYQNMVILVAAVSWCWWVVTRIHSDIPPFCMGLSNLLDSGHRVESKNISSSAAFCCAWPWALWFFDGYRELKTRLSFFIYREMSWAT